MYTKKPRRAYSLKDYLVWKELGGEDMKLLKFLIRKLRFPIHHNTSGDVKGKQIQMYVSFFFKQKLKCTFVLLSKDISIVHFFTKLNKSL